MKRCSRCLKRKTRKHFYVYTEKDPHKTGALHAACKACEHEARARHRKAHPELAAKNARRCKIKRLFGITPEQYERIEEYQGRVCAICKRPSPDGRRLHIDHCHAAKQVRGLLCHDCNRGLGIFRDDPNLFYAAIGYLKNPPALFALE